MSPLYVALTVFPETDTVHPVVIYGFSTPVPHSARSYHTSFNSCFFIFVIFREPRLSDGHKYVFFDVPLPGKKMLKINNGTVCFLLWRHY